MTIRHIIEDQYGYLYSVTNMFDENEREVNDPQLASSGVVKLDDYAWHAFSTEHVDIYTVQ